MLDTIMRNSMPLWLLGSLLYAVFVAAFLVKALRRIRRLQRMRKEALGLKARVQAAQVSLGKARALELERDWIPSA